eukprot:TRINITY_DN1946_c0_g3_i6.p2 TRINITY_DN1946_c0_g3~~TRINITY_DN1946_c0_g3_i6.p2  ORF type:complete len:125 (-),score=0.83 TRINITY_DN1946_c0_g3_i6:149-523(-)
MERADPPHLHLHPIRLPRRHFPDPNQHQLFPHELRHNRVIRRLPQPSMAPDLTHRLHSHDGRLALPLLLTRRAVGDFPPYDRRSSRACRPRGGDTCRASIDWSGAQHFGLGFGWTGDRDSSRSV